MNVETGTQTTKKRSPNRLLAKQKIAGWLFVIIPAALVFIFYFYPMIQALLLSFQSGAGNNLEFVGTGNYQRLFSDSQLRTAIKNTFTYLIFQVPIMTLLALIFAVVLNKKTLRFKGVFRTIVFLPAITSLVSYSVVFKYLFSSTGLVNQLLIGMNLVDGPIGWLSHPFWAKVLIIIAITWRWTGYNMIFYISALQNIDPEIYEAARIDGATELQQFFGITIPMLRPVILFTSITSTIGTLQLFDEPMNITQGGPGNATLSISQYIYNLSFQYTPNFGYAAAVSYVIVFFVIVLAAVQFRIGGRDND